MSRNTNFPLHSPFGMREVNPTVSARHHRGHLDTEWQRLLILSFQNEDAIYKQKVERGDPFRFAYNTTGASRSLKIIDCNGLTVATLSESAVADVAGNVTSDSTQIHAIKYALADYSALTQDGVYYLLLTVTYDLSHQTQWISHPLDLKDLHDGTMLWKYRNSENIDGTYFEALPMSYYLRIPAYIGKVIAKSTATVFEDQNQDTEQLYRKAYREFPLMIGYDEMGIPDYVYDLINHIFDLDEILLDGKQYLAASGAELSREGDNELAVLYSAKINIAPASNTEGFEYGDRTVSMYVTGTYPYFISSIFIGPYSISGPVVVEDSSAETTFLATLNTAIGATELSGTVQLSGGVVEYVNGTDENYTSATVVRYTSKFSYTQAIAAGATLPDRTKSMSLNKGSVGIDWGHGSAVAANPAALSATAYTHVYPASGSPANFTVRVFYSGLEYFAAGFGASVATGASGFTGTLPANLRELYLNRVAFTSNTFNFNYLSGLDFLQSLVISNSGLTAANNFNTNYLPSLNTINVSGNAFNNSVVSAFMYDVARNSDPTMNLIAGAGYIKAGIFAIVQSPQAVLNLTGTTYYNHLKGSTLNWTVNY